MGETLKDDEVSVYDEGTKDYIELNRLLDYISEFLWKAGEKADRPVLVNGLNETKPTYDYDSYYRGKVVNREPSEYGFVLPHEKEKMQSLEREYMANQFNRNYRRETSQLASYNLPPSPNSFRISRNRPQHGDEYYYKPSNLSESFNTHPANNEIGLRGQSPSQTIRGL